MNGSFPRCSFWNQSLDSKLKIKQFTFFFFKLKTPSALFKKHNIANSYIPNCLFYIFYSIDFI